MSALKRKRPGSDKSSKEQNPDERNIYNLIKSKGDLGIWKGDIRKELKTTNAKTVDNCIKSLVSKQMIKEVANVQAKGKKHLMAMEFEPSKELTGGVWYDKEGALNVELINNLKESCLRRLHRQKIVTAEGLCHELGNQKYSVEQVKEILDNLVLEKEIIRVTSDGMGEFASFPIKAICYKHKPPRTKTGAFSLIPCGVCPRINQCAPDGIISPVTCEYYNKWLEF